MVYHGRRGGSNWVRFVYNDDVLPHLPGVYVVYIKGRLTYIGQSADIAKRVRSYALRMSYGANWFTPWGQTPEVIIKCRFAKEYGDWTMREAQLIRRLKPPQNCLGSSLPRGQRKIRVDIMSQPVGASK